MKDTFLGPVSEEKRRAHAVMKQKFHCDHDLEDQGQKTIFDKKLRLFSLYLSYSCRLPSETLLLPYW